MTIMTALTPTSIDITMGDGVVVTGNEVVLTTFEGYQGKINMRRASTPRLNRPGDFTEQGTKGGKVISIRGEAVFNTPLEAAQFVIECESFLADGGVGVLNVNEVALGKTRSMGIELNSSEAPEVYGTTVGFGWDVYAADPAKYGEPDLFEAPVIFTPGQPIYETLPANVVRLTNNGTTTANCYFIITGLKGIARVVEQASGSILRPLVQLDSHIAIHLDGASRTFKYLYDGVWYDSTSNLNPAQWTTLAPGTSKLYRIENDPNGGVSTGTENIYMDAHVVGQSDVYRGTYNAGGNPNRQLQTGTSAPSSSPGNLTVTNNGTAPAGVVFRVEGEYENGFSIFDMKTFDAINLGGYLYGNEGDGIVLDSNTGKVYGPFGQMFDNNLMSQPNWPILDPGESRDFSLSYTSTSTYPNKVFKAEVKPKWH